MVFTLIFDSDELASDYQVGRCTVNMLSGSVWGCCRRLQHVIRALARFEDVYFDRHYYRLHPLELTTLFGALHDTLNPY